MFIKKIIYLSFCFGFAALATDAAIAQSRVVKKSNIVEFKDHRFKLFTVNGQEGHYLEGVRFPSLYPIVLRDNIVKINLEAAANMLASFIYLPNNDENSKSVQNYLAFLSKNLDILEEQAMDKALSDPHGKPHFALLAHILSDSKNKYGKTLNEIPQIEKLKNKIEEFLKKNNELLKVIYEEATKMKEIGGSLDLIRYKISQNGKPKPEVERIIKQIDLSSFAGPN